MSKPNTSFVFPALTATPTKGLTTWIAVDQGEGEEQGKIMVTSLESFSIETVIAFLRSSGYEVRQYADLKRHDGISAIYRTNVNGNAWRNWLNRVEKALAG